MSVSVEQLTALINYLEANPELAVGRFNRSKEGSSLAKRLWAECAHILNNVSSGCAHKTAASWRLYYNEYKSKLLKKKKMEKAALCATGSGEPAKDFVYTPLQNRLYGILEPYDGEPLAVVQQKEEIPDNSLSPIPSTSAVAGEDHTALPPLPFPAVRAPPPLFPAAARAAPLHNSRADILRRRRRRRQERLQSDTEEPSPHVRSATASLEAMERLGADATREHARATLRLAAAIERLAAALGGGRPCARGTAGDGQRGG